MLDGIAAAVAVPLLAAWLLSCVVTAVLEGWPPEDERMRAELFIAQQPGGLAFLASQPDTYFKVVE
jgi:hypothetical protein